MAVELTDAAAKQVKELKRTQNLSENVFLRMGVKGGGCSGLSYSLEFDSEIGPHDKEFEIDGIKVVVDKKSYLYLNGTTDRKSTRLNSSHGYISYAVFCLKKKKKKITNKK